MQAEEGRRQSQISASTSYSPGVPASWNSWVDSALSRLETAPLTRHLRPVAPSGCAVEVIYIGKQYFCAPLYVVPAVIFGARTPLVVWLSEAAR